MLAVLESAKGNVLLIDEARAPRLLLPQRECKCSPTPLLPVQAYNMADPSQSAGAGKGAALETLLEKMPIGNNAVSGRVLRLHTPLRTHARRAPSPPLRRTAPSSLRATTSRWTPCSATATRCVHAPRRGERAPGTPHLTPPGPAAGPLVALQHRRPVALRGLQRRGAALRLPVLLPVRGARGHGRGRAPRHPAHLAPAQEARLWQRAPDREHARVGQGAHAGAPGAAAGRGRVARRAARRVRADDRGPGRRGDVRGQGARGLR